MLRQARVFRDVTAVRGDHRSGWPLAGLCRAPGAVRRLPAPARLWVFRRVLGPSGGWWLRERVEGIVPVHTRRYIESAQLHGEEVRLRLGGQGDGPAEMTADHVLAATGYRIDLDALPFLDPRLRQAVARIPGSHAPRLSGAFKSSVDGLYFTGSLAAPTFGPLLRFVAGTSFAARHITVRLARPVAHRWPQPAPARDRMPASVAPWWGGEAGKQYGSSH